MKPSRQQCSEETHTDGYLDFVSHHPLSHKAAVSRTLLSQADKINMDVPEKTKEKEHVVAAHALRMNGTLESYIAIGFVTKDGSPQHGPGNL